MVKPFSLSEPEAESNDLFEQNIRASGFRYQETDIGDITFKAGQTEAVHRWYRLTPSYSPSLVRFLIAELGINTNHFVVDPFSGRGTTVIEAQKQGIRALGIEINPLLQQVGDQSLIWEVNHLALVQDYLTELANQLQCHQSYTVEQTVEQLQTKIPIIYNVFRWWQPSTLKDLIICREIMLHPTYSPIQPFLWLALNQACLDCANIHRNHPTITFDDNHQRQINVYEAVDKNLKIISTDLNQLGTQCQYSKLNAVKLGDSTQLHAQVDQSIDMIVTSPPYPNRYSYVHQTRPQLYFMELLDHARQATEIDLQAIGGTWGRATSVLQHNLIEPPAEIRPYLCYYDHLQSRSTLMCNYATKYFIDLWRHIQSLNAVKSQPFRGAYVVGNSRLSGVEIFTEVILGQLFEQTGFEVEKIVGFRKRGGKKRLYETAILIRS